MLQSHGFCCNRKTTCPEKEQKKTPARSWRSVIEAGFIQARNLSSSALVIRNAAPVAKLKV
jgi:hypothetical protein